MANQNVLMSCKTCEPCQWVLATLCAGQTLAVSDPPIIYVLKSGIPDPFVIVFPVTMRTFAASGHPVLVSACYRVDASDPSILPPRGVPNARYLESVPASESDCFSCVEEVPPGGGGGGGVQPPGGGGDIYGWPAIPCPDQTDAPTNLWITGGGALGGVFPFTYGIFCFTFDATLDGTVMPSGKVPVSMGQVPVDCDGCRYSYPIYPCPGQAVAYAPPLYLRQYGLPLTNPTPGGGPFIFRLDGVCYFFDAENPPGVLLPPPGATLLRALYSGGYETCDDCALGVVAEVQPCKPLPGGFAPPVWVPKVGLPDADVTFEVDGICYTLHVGGDLVYKPPDAVEMAQAPDEYSTCDNCLCGERTSQLGLKVNPCAGDEGAPWLESLWIQRPTSLDADWFFIYQKVCCYVLASQVPQRIPASSKRISGGRGFEDCMDCFGAVNPPPGGPGDPPPPLPPPPHYPPPLPPPVGPPPPPNKPPGPPNLPPPPGRNPPPFPPRPPGGPNPPFPPTLGSNQLKRCSDSVIVDVWIDKKWGMLGKVINLAGDTACVCYEVIGTSRPGAGGAVPGQTYDTCAGCAASCLWIQLAECGTGDLIDYYVKKIKYIAGGGAARPVYYLNIFGSLKCYSASGPTTPVPPAAGHEVDGTRFTSCDDARCFTAFVCPDDEYLTANCPLTKTVTVDDPDLVDGCAELNGAWVVTWDSALLKYTVDTGILFADCAGCPCEVSLQCEYDGGVPYWRVLVGNADGTNAQFRKLIGDDRCPRNGSYDRVDGFDYPGMTVDVS